MIKIVRNAMVSVVALSAVFLLGCPSTNVPTDDLCDGVTCEDGDTCTDGVCEADADPCEGVFCEDGETCVDGVCEVDAIDPCDDVTCEEGETCVDGVCVVDSDPCDGVTCEDGETCVEGVCESSADAAAGESFFSANNCSACHGADAAGVGNTPGLDGVSSTTILEKLDGTESHGGGTTDGATAEDAANIEAWVASLSQ